MISPLIKPYFVAQWGPTRERRILSSKASHQEPESTRGGAQPNAQQKPGTSAEEREHARKKRRPQGRRESLAVGEEGGGKKKTEQGGKKKKKKKKKKKSLPLLRCLNWAKYLSHMW